MAYYDHKSLISTFKVNYDPYIPITKWKTDHSSRGYDIFADEDRPEKAISDGPNQ